VYKWESEKEKILPLKEEYGVLAQTHLDQLTKPQGSLGRLEEVGKQLVQIYQEVKFEIEPVKHFVFVGDHGIVSEGVSLYPQEVTTQMVYNFLQGGAAINVLTRLNQVEIAVVDVGMKERVVDERLIQRKIRAGAGNFLREKAMNKEEAKKGIAVGYELAEEAINAGARMLSLGEMGIGNTTTSTIITAHLLDLPVSEVIGRGTGLNDQQLNHKQKVIEEGLKFHNLPTKEVIETLSAFGGLEHAAMVGVILAAARNQIPVILDGFNTGAAALIAKEVNSLTTSYLFAGHVSEEPGHAHILKALGLKPLLNLNMRLGEGTGAIMALSLIKGIKAIMWEMATFEEAHVSQRLE